MKFQDIVTQIDRLNIPPDILNVEVNSLCSDSRKVVADSVFVVLPGPQTHGIKFIQDAVKRGAKIIVVKADLPFDQDPGPVDVVRVADPRLFLVDGLRKFYQNPGEKIKLIGITGTNGKTTIAYLCEALCSAAGKSCGVVGTINHRYAGTILRAGNTTPGISENFQILSEMVRQGVEYCAMEVSSHALDQHRVDGLNFTYAIFSNLTSDHLDYHKDQEAYFMAKANLFIGLNSLSRAIINTDDQYGKRLITMTSAKVWTYGLNQPADFFATGIRLQLDSTEFDLVTPAGQIHIRTPLVGKHNISNILSVAAVGVSEGYPLEIVKKGIENVSGIPGRLENIQAGQDFYVFIDYAHTEDALVNVLSSIRNLKTSRMIVVFGCGGDRDKTKRAKMAAVVEQWADYAIVTNDNPRTENPESIVSDIRSGFSGQNYAIILDRRSAIAESLKMAQPGDIVVIAGKGHESYQIFKDKTIDFNEREIVLELLRNERWRD